LTYLKNNKIFFLLLVYTLTFFPILLNDGIYWDGWVINNLDATQLIQIFKDNGNYWYGYLFAGMLEYGDIVIISRVVTFFSYFFTTVFFYLILKKYSHGLNSYSLFFALYFLTFPVNFARITIMNTPYAVCLLLFFMAYFIYIKDAQNIYKVILASILLFLSLFMSSLLFFIPVLIAHKFILYDYRLNIFSVKKFAIKNITLIAIPIIFVILKLSLFQPSGIYQNLDYNKITLSRIIELPIRLLESIYSSVLYPINLAFEYATSNVMIVVFIVIILNNLSLFPDSLFSTKNLSKVVKLKIIKPFLFVLFLGLFSYLLVGKTPSLSDWNSRHQILVPFGASILLFYFVIKVMLIVQNIKLRRFVAFIPVSMFIVFNINIYFSYIIDWYKQVSLIEHIKISHTVHDSSTFLVIDNTKKLNAMNRNKSFIDYTGFLKKEFKKQDQFVEEVENYSIDNIVEYLQYKNNGIYGINKWIPSRPEFVLVVDYGSYKVNNIVVIKMMLNHLINPEKNMKNIKNILKVKVERVEYGE
jgi:hypothetical protein